MSWICPHCNKNVAPGHTCTEGFEVSGLGKAMIDFQKTCDGCRYLTPTEEQQDRMPIKIRHRCTALSASVFHFGAHPSIMKHPLCKGKVLA
mgnify:CR=1 FL=1